MQEHLPPPFPSFTSLSFPSSPPFHLFSIYVSRYLSLFSLPSLSRLLLNHPLLIMAFLFTSSFSCTLLLFLFLFLIFHTFFFHFIPVVFSLSLLVLFSSFSSLLFFFYFFFPSFSYTLIITFSSPFFSPFPSCSALPRSLLIPLIPHFLLFLFSIFVFLLSFFSSLPIIFNFFPPSPLFLLFLNLFLPLLIILFSNYFPLLILPFFVLLLCLTTPYSANPHSATSRIHLSAHQV